MKEISLMHDNGLPRFLEAFIDPHYPKFDSLKLRNGLLDAIPGVIWKDRFRQVWEKESDEKHVAAAFIGFVCTSAYAQALIRYNLNKTIEGKVYYEFATALKKLIDETNVYIESFDPDQFWGRATEPYLTLFKKFGDKIGLSENLRVNTQKYVRDYARILLIDFCRHNVPPASILGIITSDKQLVEDDLRKQEYMIRLKNEYTDITLNDDKGMTLDAIYQEPSFKIYEKCLKEGEYEKDKHAFVSAEKIDLKENVHEFTEKWLRGQLKSPKIKAHLPRLLLLYGFPGQGKTSFCKRLVYDLLEESRIGKDAYMVRLKNISNPSDLKSDVLETIKSHLKNKYDFYPKNLEESTLILDGLDELLMKNKLKSEDVEDIFQNIRDSLRGNDDLRIIVTSRFGYLDLERLSAASILILQLEEFDFETQVQWLQKYTQFHDTWLIPSKLKNINNSKSHLRELVGQPILLHLVATLEKGLNQDINRSQVYELLFDQITNPKKWKKDQIALLEGLDAEDLRKALQQMAYEIWRSGDGYIHKSVVRELNSIKDIEKKLRGGGQFQDVLKVMMVAFYFQEVAKNKYSAPSEDSSQYAIEFFHKSLQEYLTAEHIWFEILDKFLSSSIRRKYTLEEGGKALEVLQEIFGNQELSVEIQDYLVEVIHNHRNQQHKKDLAARFDYFFDYFLQKDFLQLFDGQIMDYPFQISARIFYGFWTVFSHLQVATDYLKNEQRKKLFAGFLKALGGGTKLNFSGIDLSGANLIGVNLSNANLIGTTLSGANLRGADLRGSNMKEAELVRANLIGSNLVGAKMGGANLSSAKLMGANLSYANLEDTKLFNAVLSGADLGDANLTDADLRKADLSGADFSDSSLRGYDLGDDQNLPIQLSFRFGAILKGADLSGAFIGGTKFSGAHMEEANLSNLKEFTIIQFLLVQGIENTKGLPAEFHAKILHLQIVNRLEFTSEEEE